METKEQLVQTIKNWVKIDNEIFKGTYKYVALPMEDLVQRPIY